MLEQDIKELTTAVNALTAALKAQSALPTTVGNTVPQTDIKADTATPAEAPKPAEPKAEKPKAKVDESVTTTLHEAELAPDDEAAPAEAMMNLANKQKAPAAHNLTQDDMKEYIKKAFTLCGGAPITSALQAFGKGKLPDVPFEDYPKLLQHLKDACPELEV